jgi:charged multivesicular body protein 7
VRKLISHQERVSLVIKALSEIEWRHVCVVTMTRFRELCGSTETADVLTAVLINQGRALHLKLNGKENIEVCLANVCFFLISISVSYYCDLILFEWFGVY